jgi:hypothetical protein
MGFGRTRCLQSPKLNLPPPRVGFLIRGPRVIYAGARNASANFAVKAGQYLEPRCQVSSLLPWSCRNCTDCIAVCAARCMWNFSRNLENRGFFSVL